MQKLFFIIFIFYIWAFWIEPNLLTIKKYRIESFSRTRIVFVSDFHIAKYDKRRLKRIIKLINNQKPDLVISGGDYIKGHTGKTTLDIETIAYELSKIKAPVYTVLGNHDGWFDKYRVKKALEKNGINVLSNSNIKYENITIAGVEDLQTSTPEPEVAIDNAERPIICITHTPDTYYDFKTPVDLILAGHVHGGQVRLPFYGALIAPSKYGTKFSCGYFNETGNPMIVTKGLGTSILSMRFNAIPEIVVIN